MNTAFASCDEGQWAVMMTKIGCASCISPPPLEQCAAPRDTGPCKAMVQRWWYSAASDSCEPFTYGGCGGNDNNFRSYDECLESCQGMTRFTARFECSEPPKVQGPCEAAFPRWSFDVESGSCQQFMYGGCHGNGNNFESQQECSEACHSGSEEQPPDSKVDGVTVDASAMAAHLMIVVTVVLATAGMMTTQLWAL